MPSAVTAYTVLFAWSFLAATILPLSSEAPLAALVYQRREWVLPVLVATIGNYLGACTTYGLARAAARATGAGAGGGRFQQQAVRLCRQGSHRSCRRPVLCRVKA